MGTPLASRTFIERLTVEEAGLCWLPRPPPVGFCAKAEAPQSRSMNPRATKGLESVNWWGRTWTMVTLARRKTYRYTTHVKPCRQGSWTGQEPGKSPRKRSLVVHGQGFELVFAML